MKRLVWICLLSTLALISSCAKFLEETSQSELVPRTAESLNELLLGEGYPHNGTGLHPGAHFFNDDIENFKEGFQPNSFYVYTWQPDMIIQSGKSIYARSPWMSIYRYLQACNTVLDYLPKVEGTPSLKNYVEGQARLLRAFYYMKLVNFYGLPYNDKQSDPNKNLAVPLMTVGGVAAERKSRNTVKEVYTQIETDLLEGIRLVEQSGVTHNKYRIGSAAGHLLVSRAYLYMEQWDKVIEHTSAVLAKNSSLFDLRAWGEPNPLTKPVVGLTGIETLWGFGAVEDVMGFGSPVERALYQLSYDLTNSFEEGDLRNGIYFYGGLGRKVNFQSFTPIVGQAFRVSEAYLNRAEAYAQRYKAGKPEDGEASIRDLNTLREKRFSADKYVPWILEGTADQLLQRIREERRRELFEEEDHRWFDLRRYGMPRMEHVFHAAAGVSETYVLEERDPSYLLPIPDDAIALNPNLKQNPLAPIRKPK